MALVAIFGLVPNSRTISEVLGRAGYIWVHFFRGSTLAAIVGELVTMVLVQLLRRRLFTTNRQWGLSLKDGWRLIGLDAAIATGIVALMTFIISLSMARFETRTYTFQEIANYGKTLMLAVSDNESDVIPRPPYYTNSPGISRAGFWINTNGYALTCFALGKPPNRWGCAISEIIPTQKQQGFPVLAGLRTSAGRIMYYDSDTGIGLILAYRNPFERQLTVAGQVIDHHTPRVSTNSIKEGDPVFLVAIDQAEKEMTTRTKKGIVESIGVNTKTHSNLSENIHTSIPFHPLYVGSPIFDNHRDVVGIVTGGSASETIFIPSIYIINRFHIPTSESADKLFPPALSDMLDMTRPMDVDEIKAFFEEKIGSMSFRTETNSPAEFNIVSPERALFFYQKHFVIFISLRTNGNPFALCRFLKESATHLVFVSWAPDGASLGVDGDFVWEPASFGGQFQ